MSTPRTIITAALTGSRGSKRHNPNTPITPDEIIEDAYRCYQAGAAVVHIHLKADDGETAEINNDKFRYILAAIREKCDVVVNVSTSGELNNGNQVDFIGTPDGIQEKRLGILELQPEMATLDIPTMNFTEQIFMNPLSFLRVAGKKMKEQSILPEVEIFSIGDIDQVERLIEEEQLSTKLFYQFCMGVRGGTPATVKNLLYLREALPKDANWSAFGIGAEHLPILYATIALGGHVRVGLEDNLYYHKGQLTSNVALVERAVRLVKEFGNDIATPNQAREILGIE